MPVTLVLGGTGMLGSAITRCLFNSAGMVGKRVVSVGSDDCDLTNQHEVSMLFRLLNPTDVYHCAGFVGGIQVNAENQYEMLYENSMMALNVINAALENGVKRFVYVSSSCAYPTGTPQPMEERTLEYAYLGQLPSSNRGYATAKTVGQLACQYAAKKGGIWLTAVPCNLYGPGDDFSEDGHVLASLVAKFVDAVDASTPGYFPSVTIWGSGKPRREFLWVDDAAAAIINVAHRTGPGAPIVNIGSGVDLTIAELANKIKKEVGFTSDIIYDATKPDGVHQKLLNVHKLKTTIYDWKPTVDIDIGIIRMIKAYRALKKEIS